MDKNINEKKLGIILFSTAFIAILIVILFNIPWGGKAGEFRKSFGLEDKDHIFVEINYKNFEKMMKEEKEFQVFIGTPKDTQSAQFVYEANDLAKEYNVKTIYYLNSDRLSVEQIDTLEDVFLDIMSFPTLAYFSNKYGEYKLMPASCWKNLEEFDNNWYKLIKEYFEDCYK